ncbi:MAG: ABC transporter ATP-binding protein [Clostridiales bacterium]|jgi:NitT/TauT family transport system ATP-binding protein|nr:ABC transporter ATP-binding protein [Clostridiales bacterium]
MIVFDRVCFAFGETVVLDNFCDSFESGKINCLLGPSGSGKTTVLNLIAGLLKPQSGKIEGDINGVSYVFQESRLIPQKTVYANLDAILRPVYPDKRGRRDIIEEHLTLAGLLNDSDKYPHELSGGMRQRLSLIRAFAFPSNVLLMDEPFKGLDLQLKNSITEAFLRLWRKEKRTVIFVTHEIDDALRVGDSIRVYSDKPLTLLKLIDIPPSAARSKLYGEAARELKEQVCLEVERWGDAE